MPEQSKLQQRTPGEISLETRNHLRERAARYTRALPDGLPTPLIPTPRTMRDVQPLAPETQAVPSPPSAASLVYSRLAFGPAAGDIAAFNALGATDAQRLQVWVNQQTNPASINDTVANNRIAQSGFTTLNKSLTQLWADHVVPDNLPWEEVMRPFYETTYATFLRAIFSKRQLFEVMVEFWHIHFSVYADGSPNGPVWPHTDRDVIRAQALGNFRQMLEGIAKSPAMLYYLNNNNNSQEDPNENYARENFELHTMGAEAYYGSLAPNLVPRDANNIPLGYTETDVIEAARCLTGWTVSDRSWDPVFGDTGNFYYHAPWHDQGAKTVVGLAIPANQPPLKDGQDLFTRLANHPATARFIAKKLCRRLIGDSPPQSVVDAAAATFAANVNAADQIARVVRTIVLAPEFLTTWGDKIKRPFDIAVSMFRGTGGDLPFVINDSATEYFYWTYYQTGMPLFAWQTPNGYPDFKAAWSSTAPRVTCWRLVNMLIQVDDVNSVYYFDILGQTPASARSAQELVTYWTERIMGRPAAPAEEAELVEFMAQGFNPNLDLPLATDGDTQTRLRALVALICMTPSFLFR